MGTADELEQLARLHRSGELDDDEFREAKARVIAADERDDIEASVGLSRFRSLKSLPSWDDPPNFYAPKFVECDPVTGLAVGKDEGIENGWPPKAAGHSGLADTPTKGVLGWFARATKYSPGHNRSYDWCRYRHNE